MYGFILLQKKKLFFLGTSFYDVSKYPISKAIQVPI